MKNQIENSLLPYIKHKKSSESKYWYCRKSFIQDALSEDSELIYSSQFLRLSALEESLVYIIKKTKNRDIEFLLEACKYIERTINWRYFREEMQGKKNKHRHPSAHSGNRTSKIKYKDVIIKHLFAISLNELPYSERKKSYPFTEKAHKEIIEIALQSKKKK